LGEIDRIAEIMHSYKQDPRYLLALLLDIQESENHISTSIGVPLIVISIIFAHLVNRSNG
jgi:hypothetical protein